MSATHDLDRGVLGTSDIVFMVMAAAAPMAGVVALMPMAFAFGNGGGVPGTYLGVIGAMLLFAVGFVRIIPFVKNAGAFYAYIAASIGKAWGLAAAYVAAFSYFALSCSTLAALAFFSEQFFEQTTGMKLHWSVWAFSSTVLLCWLAYHRITLAATVLTIALAAEILVILVLDFAIVAHVGWRGFDLHDFSISSVLAPGLGITAIYGFNSVIGIEGSAIYQEEARRREVTIPRATYLAVVMVGLFYVFTAWCLTSSAGAANVSSVAKSDPGSFILRQGVEHLGKLGGDAISLLVLTSSFAAALGLFNNSARYLYALGRDGVMPKALARAHPKHHSPHVAGFWLTGALLVVFFLSVLANLDPLVNITTALVGVGSVGLMALVGITALAIPVFFAKQGRFSWGTTAAPAIGGIVIVSATVLAFANYSAVTGVDSAFINHLPYLLIALALFGAGQALWLRARNPTVYRQIASTRIDDRTRDQ